MADKESSALLGRDARPRSSLTPSLAIKMAILLIAPTVFGYSMAFTGTESSGEAVLQLCGKDAACPDASKCCDKDTCLSNPCSNWNWFTSVITLGAMAGAVVGGPLIQSIGRKGGFVIAATTLGVGWFFFIIGGIYHETLSGGKGLVPLWIASRVLVGAGVGMISLVTPMYIPELAPAEFRGGLGSCFQLFITIGILIIYVLSSFCSYMALAYVGIGMVGLAILAVVVYLPESPRWLVLKRKNSRARKVLVDLRGTPEVDDELGEIVEAARSRAQTSSSGVSFSDPCVYKPLGIAMGLMMYQQLCGINGVLFNAANIFKSAGVNNATIANIILGAAQVVFTGLATVIIDKLGRKLLLLGSGLVVGLSCILLGLFFKLGWTHDNASAFQHDACAACVILYISGFAIGLGPVPWLMMGEVFPSAAKGVAGSIATLTNWTLAFVVAQTFNPLKQLLSPKGEPAPYIPGTGYLFWIYGGICVVLFVWGMIFLPETKGKSLEQIQASFKGKKHGDHPDEPAYPAIPVQ